MSLEIFLVVNERVQVSSDTVYIRDVASIYTLDQSTKNRLEKQILFQYGKNEIIETRQVVSTLYIIKTMEQVLKQTQLSENNASNYFIIPITNNDCIVERLPDQSKQNKVTEKWKNVFKVSITCLLCLIGGAFSIMAFHNDVGLNDIFAQFYELVTGEKSSGFTILEISYSIGLMSGIIIFYDHIGKRRISKDPTPIEVSMRTYEQDMNQAMIQTWEREGKKIDVK